MSYNSKYTGQEVEDLLDQVKNGSVGGSAAYPMVDHGASDTTFELTPNAFHVWGEVAELDLTLGEEISGVTNEYLFQFTSGENATTLSVPSDIAWAITPEIEANSTYQISILNKKATYLLFSEEVKDEGIIENEIHASGGNLVFTYPTASDLEINVTGRISGAPSNYTLSVPKGTSIFTDTGLSSIMYINLVTPKQDDKYIYVYDIS